MQSRIKITSLKDRNKKKKTFEIIHRGKSKVTKNGGNVDIVCFFHVNPFTWILQIPRGEKIVE